MNENDYPRVLTRDQVRFEIAFGLSQVPASLVREWKGKDREKSDRARAAVAETIVARFDRLQVRSPAPVEPFFQDRVGPR